MDSETGERRWDSEISSIDTALLLGGVLTVRQCFKDDAEIVRLATAIYERMDFRWMLNGDANYLSHGWKDETGFLESRWTDYSEQTMLNLLAIVSPNHNISWTTWYETTTQNFDFPVMLVSRHQGRITIDHLKIVLFLVA